MERRGANSDTTAKAVPHTFSRETIEILDRVMNQSRGEREGREIDPVSKVPSSNTQVLH